jgi:mannose-1-phosphate guanylyltransferase
VDRVIVLAGGFATRLRPLSYTRPKPLFPILGKPLIDWILERAKDIAPVVISARYLADMIKSHIAARWSGASVVEEGRPLGDGGAVAYIADMLSLSSVMAINGDVFTDMDLKAVAEYHKRKGGAATIAFVEVPAESLSKYGVGVMDDSLRLVDFVEKPKEPPAGSRLANAGVYIFEEEALREIPRRPGEVKIAKDVMPALLKKYDVYVYVHKGIWLDIGTPQDYLRANFVALDSFGSTAPRGAEVVPPVYIAEDAEVGRGAVVGPYAVVGPGSRIGEYARVRNSVLMGRAYVESGAYISGSIIGDDAYVGKWARVMEAAVADGVYIRDEVYVGRGASIGPNREVAEDVPEGATLP